MRKNKVKEMMKAGKPVINGWLQIPSTVSAEVMAHQGWDSLTIDMQHGLVDYTNALPMLQTISTTDVTPLARPSRNLLERNLFFSSPLLSPLPFFFVFF